MPESAAPPPERTDERDPVKGFVGHLHGLVKRAPDDGTARAALAELRRSAANPAGRYGALRIVGQHVPDDARGDALDAYLLTAELFGIYAAGGSAMSETGRMKKGRRSLGASARLVNGRRVSGQGDAVDENEGITRRFQALLALPLEDVPDELRRFLRLLRSHDAPVDFFQLLRDLLAWDHPDRFVQQRWARDYWPSTLDTADSSPDTD